MFDQLHKVVRHYEDLTQRLASGTLSPREFQNISREQAGLRETVEVFIKYTQAKNEVAGCNEILQNESDEDLRAMAKEDIPRLEHEIKELAARLKILLLPKDPNDEKNILLEIRAGTGGEEASLFAGDLFRMYARFAEIMQWSIEILSDSLGEKGGFKEVICLVSGDKVYSKLKYESGTHRVQRVPDTEASGRVHTSAVTVAVIPEAEEVDIVIPETEIKTDVMRAGGAGGQHVNKTESAVRLTHIPTGLVVLCRDERSQHKNKARAMKVLRSRLLELKQSEQLASEASIRQKQVGSGDRSEKIRTYNFPQSRVTDHRIGLTLHNLDDILNGKLGMVVDALLAYYQAEALRGGTN